MKKLFSIITSLSLALALSAQAATDNVAVVWDSPSADSRGSMPIGNGDIGANVWVEPSGDLLLLLSKSDAWDEVSRLCKLGLLRIKLPSVTGFRQELRLADGEIRITAGGVTTRVWIDANQPVVNVEMAGTQTFTTTVAHETWRTQEKTLTGAEVRACWGQVGSPDPLIISPDTVLDGQNNQIVFFHRNPTSVWEKNLRNQGLDALVIPANDPLLHRTFGALVRGENLIQDGKNKLTAAQPATSFSIKVHALTARTPTAGDWVNQVTAQAQTTEGTPLAAARTAHANWWQAFWNRSWIVANESGSSAAQTVTNGYTLQRWVNACAGRGAYPIKFNGSLFTVETLTNPVQSYNGHCQFDADFREWGNPYWTQNTRLMYWTMPAAGDFDLMMPFFKMYMDALPLRKTITRLAFNHDGALFPETMEFWGGAPDSDFGRNTGLPPGQTGHGYMQYYPHGALEILNVMYSYYEFTGDTAFRDSTLLPFGKEIIDYYRLHWPLTAEGKIRLTGLTSLEQATDTTNPAPDIAGLRAILPKLAACTPDAAQSALWTNMQAALPPLPMKVSNGQQILTLAEITPARVSGFEKPELYAVFPYRLYGVGRPDLDLGLETWRQRGNQGTGGWQQDAIQAAVLGLANEAKTYITQNYERTSPGFRFQAMWGPNYDWIPDQDHGCVPMSAMQSMLLQPVGDRLILLPAWPSEWNVSFKLHAPQNTTIECEVTNGTVTKLIVTPQSRLQNVEISSPFVPMQATLPTAPTGLGATAVSASTIKLGWDDIAVNETGYRVERSTTSGSGFTQIAELAAGATAYSDLAIHASTTYYYRVCATNALGNSAWSSEASATSRPQGVVTTIMTDGFNTGAWAPADPWGINAANTVGQWSLAQTAAGGGRLVIGNPWGYGGQATPQEGTGQAQFSNGVSPAFVATLKDTTGHAFAVGQEVAMNFYMAGRSGTNSMALTVDLVDGNHNVIHTFGSYAPTNGSNTWSAFTTDAYTIATPGTYGVRFTSATSGGDLTTYLDAVSYSVTSYPFTNWMATTYPAVVSPDNLPGADPDHDGIANLLEYLLQGGDPSKATTGTLPTVNVSGANFVFTYFRRAATTGITQTFQYGSTLNGWTNVGIPGGSGVIVTDQGGGIEKVEVTVVIGANTKLFGRLHVTQP